MLWAIRSLLAIAVALAIGALVVTYTADGRDFGYWYVASLTVGFAILLFSGWHPWARVMRVVVGLALVVSVLSAFGVCARFGSAAAACSQWVGLLDYRRDLLTAWSMQAHPFRLVVTVLQAVLALSLLTGFGADGLAFLAGLFFFASVGATIGARGPEVALGSAAPLLSAGSFMISAVLTTQAVSNAKRDDPVMLAFDEAQQRQRDWGKRYRDRLNEYSQGKIAVSPSRASSETVE